METTAGTTSSEKSTRSWAESLSHLGHWLPSQGPIQHFIHHNTLHAFQDFAFFDGVRAASRIYGSRSLAPLREFREAHGRGEISDDVIRATVARKFPSEIEGWVGKMTTSLSETDDRVPRGWVDRGLRALRKERLDWDLDARVHSLLFRLIGGFLDQGIALWRMPMPRPEATFHEAVLALAESSVFPLVPGRREALVAKLKAHQHDAGITQTLSELVGPESAHERYVLEMLLSHAGWSGLVHQVEQRPDQLLIWKKISLRDLVAVELAIEACVLEREFGKGGVKPLLRDGDAWAWPVEPHAPQPTPVETALELWQEAREDSYTIPILNSLSDRAKSREAVTSTARASHQVFFCIDDRECSTRRYLETLLPSVETFGVPGFFGIDCFYLPLGSEVLDQRCPAPISPKHVIAEQSAAKKGGAVRRSPLVHGSSNTLFRGWVMSHLAGWWAGVRFAFDMFLPRTGLSTVTSIGRMPAGIAPEWSSNETPQAVASKFLEGRVQGYDYAQAAQRVEGVLRSSGLTRGFAPLVVLFAHGASSSNNPHFAAYDCGACSGRPGASNSRIAASMANHPEVRKILADRGISIPADTWFVGGIHDTTRDRIEIFDGERVPSSHRAALDELLSKMTEVLLLNAGERCRKFLVVPEGISNEKALKEVEHRALAIFEPRPEMNHATNAFCIVGRRSWTRGLNLDRRAFLQSYEPESDPEGKLLAGILSAAIPVCGGINLEYFFSRIDNEVYGAGTKLPHNVTGLLAVANGVSGDVRTGLPLQMIEIHDPLRLFLVIQQKHSIVEQAIRSVAGLHSWVKNSWVRVIAIDPTTGERKEIRHV